MQITVNDKPHDISSQTLGAALVELGFEHPAIATALNGTFVPKSDRDITTLTAGDRLEVLAPMQGG